METTVTELLREFPKIRRAAMRGERIVIRTRAGNLLLQRESDAQPLLGCLKNKAADHGLQPHESVFTAKEWGTHG